MTTTPDPVGDGYGPLIAWCDHVLANIGPEKRDTLSSVRTAYERGIEDGARMTLEQLKRAAANGFDVAALNGALP